MLHTVDKIVASLHYVDTKEVLIPVSGGSVVFPLSKTDRFLTCPKAIVQVNSDQDEVVEGSQGDLFYLPGDRSFFITNRSASDVKVNVIHFELKNSTLYNQLVEPYFLMSFQLPLMRNWMREFVKEADNQKLTDYFQLQSRLYTIASACLKAYQKQRDEASLTILPVEKIKQQILANYESALDIDQLAKSTGISVNRFYQNFRKHTGLSPNKFIIMTRLNASLRLLSDPHMSVSESAHSVGYSDEYYFSRLFKKHMGLTPTSFAARAKVRIANLCPLYTGDLKVLGLTPVYSLERDWHLDYENIPLYLTEIKKTEPNLILTGPISDSLYLELNKIAPVTMYYWHQMSWKLRLTEISRLLGLEGIADRFLSDYNNKITNARQHVEIHFPETPFLLVGVRESGFRIYGQEKRKFTDILYDEMNFKAAPASAQIGFMDIQSMSEAAHLECDHVIFLIEFQASEEFCENLAAEWRMSKLGSKRRDIFFIHLDAPFLYNAGMHERLVDQTVQHLQAIK